jgi:hypothetical protein
MESLDEVAMSLLLEAFHREEYARRGAIRPDGEGQP